MMENLSNPILGLLLLPFGLVFGSFLNVCVYRIPLHLSLVFPGSHCPHCKKSIKPYDNIPLISYLVLKGRCRFCKTSISIRYPLVEALTGVLTVGIVLSNGLNLLSLKYLILVYILLVVAIVDLDHLIIPNGVTLFGVISGLVFLLFGKSGLGWKEALMGALLVGGFLYASGGLGKLLFRKESMGFGDVKLGFMIGLFIGWEWGIVALFLSFFLASLVGIPGLISRRIQFGQRIPFGPFLSLGSILTLFFGEWIIQFYLTNIFYQ